MLKKKREREQCVGSRNVDSHSIVIDSFSVTAQIRQLHVKSQIYSNVVDSVYFTEIIISVITTWTTDTNM